MDSKEFEFFFHNLEVVVYDDRKKKDQNFVDFKV
jgi:hypothetical protein